MWERLTSLYRCLGFDLDITPSLDDVLDSQFDRRIIHRITLLANNSTTYWPSYLTHNMMKSGDEVWEPEYDSDPLNTVPLYVKNVISKSVLDKPHGGDQNDRSGITSHVEGSNITTHVDRSGITSHVDRSGITSLVDNENLTSVEDAASEETNEEGKTRNFVLLRSNERKLYITNINYRTSQKKLWEFFQKFGPVEYCKLLRDFRKRSKGRGFVTFETEEVANQAVDSSEEERTLDNRVLYLQPAMWKKYLTETTGECRSDSTTDLQQNESGSTLSESRDKTASVAGVIDSSGHCTTPVDNLNDDILIMIFSYLSLRDRIQGERVCKRWQKLLPKSWLTLRHLHFDNLFTQFGAMTERRFRAILKKRCPLVVSVDLTASPRLLSDGALDALGHRCPGLTKINMSGVSASNKGLQKLYELCPKLQWVRMKNCHEIGEKGFWWLFHRCKDLQYVDLEGNRRITGQCLHVLGGNVKTLVVDGCTKLQNVGLEKIALRCHQLTELRLNDCMSLSDTGLDSLTKDCTSLQIVYLGGYLKDMTSSGLRHLGRLVNLRELYLSSNIHTDDIVLHTIGQHCRQLRVLDISRCHAGVTDVGMQALSGCHHLETLNISYLHQVHDAGLQDVVINGCLRKLIARGCGGITDYGFQLLARVCYDIDEVDVSGNFQITNETLIAFIEAFDWKLKTLQLTIGGSSIESERLDLPTTLTLIHHDLCEYHLRPDRDLVFNLGDEESSENEDLAEYEEMEAFLDGDDPLEMERWEMS